jgi:hypothetical protein
MGTAAFTSPVCRRRRSPSVLLITLAALSAPVCERATADTVMDWNEIMQATVAAGPATIQCRSGAIVQLAVFEAVNSISGDYQPYFGAIAEAEGASPDAAVVAAAHRTLVALYPASAGALDAAKTTSLAALADGPDKTAGIAVGEAAAATLLQIRANDGSPGNAPYTPGTAPGDWQPAPPSLTPASQPAWGQVTPFGLESGSQFRLPPPPALNSGKYANDLNEVQLVGSATAPESVRPQHRTDVARFFAVSSPVQAWNLAARQVSAAQGKTLSENARIFALLGMAMADASIAVYETKYFYNFWRPQMAILGADTDGNEKTAPEAGWTPLIATPAFPSYPSGHACVSSAARRVLERQFGNHGHAITLTSPRAPGIVLNYTAFKQICEDIDDARVYGGIHFQFEQDAGTRQGREVAIFILENYLLGPGEE